MARRGTSRGAHGRPPRARRSPPSVRRRARRAGLALRAGPPRRWPRRRPGLRLPVGRRAVQTAVHLGEELRAAARSPPRPRGGRLGDQVDAPRLARWAWACSSSISARESRRRRAPPGLPAPPAARRSPPPAGSSTRRRSRLRKGSTTPHCSQPRSAGAGGIFRRPPDSAPSTAATRSAKSRSGGASAGTQRKPRRAGRGCPLRAGGRPRRGGGRVRGAGPQRRSSVSRHAGQGRARRRSTPADPRRRARPA